MPKDEIRNTCFLITTKENFLSRFYKTVYYYMSNICSLLRKFHYPIEAVLNSLQT